MKYVNNSGEVFEGDLDISIIRHTASHCLAQAIKRLYPEAKLAIGPAIDTGFYYDFDNLSIKEGDLEKIEEEMRKVIKENLKIESFCLPKSEALELMKDEPYKTELINDLDSSEKISFFKQGEFTDLCTGPHLLYTKGVKAFKLLSATGAYWRGNEKNKMLTRIYGTAFEDKEKLEEYLKQLEEAKERDHRKIGRELGIFMTSELVGKGLPMYLPNGYILWETLENYIKGKEKKLGYKHVLTPPLGSVNLYKTSGHWDHYREDMFPKMEVDGEEFVLRPMNCPHHMMIYSNSLHSYRDLPIRIGEIARDCRFEDSGALKGIERARTFCQNDAHLFVTLDQVESEFKSVVDLILECYKELNITNYRFELSLRDKEDKEKYFQDDNMWDKAETMLRKVLDDIGIDYVEKTGEAAFYGPKLDVQVKPAVGNEITISTCQLDFCLPMKFNLSYVDKDGSKKTPVVLHRAVFGSIDRFIAYYLEETKGHLPLWLAPVQIKVLPISENEENYAVEIKDKLASCGYRVEVDSSNEKIGYKIRQAQLEKVPYMIVLGKNETENGVISVRANSGEKYDNLKIEEFMEKIK